MATPTVTPTHLLVCPQRLAADAGQQVFERGGNAADAAIAAAFVQGVVDPFMCSLGGTSTAMIWDARRQDLYTLNCAASVGSVPPPAHWLEQVLGTLETVGRVAIEGNENQLGYKSIMVPGFVRGAQELHHRLGSGMIPWRDLVTPAAEIAERGFVVGPHLAHCWLPADDAGHPSSVPGSPIFDDKIHATPDATATFMKDGNGRYQAGDRLVQRDLAGTLRTLAEEGPESFYTGAIGKVIVEDFRRGGALIDETDLRNYQAKTRRPIGTHYRGDWIVTNPPPARGVPVLEMLNIAEGWDLRALEPGSPRYIDRLTGAMRCAFRDYSVYGDDPDYADVPIDLLLSKERAAAWRAAIEAGRGDAPPDGNTGIPPGTTHITATDADGNIVLWTHSIGSIAGSGVVTPGLGFLYNNFLGFFDPRPDQPRSLVPGKRTAGGGSCIVFRDGRPVLALGSPGGSRIVSAALQVMINVLDLGMDAQEAVAAPRFHSEEAGKVFVEPAFPEETREALTRMGYDVERSTYMARVQAIRIDAESGRLGGGTDPRAEGGIAAWPGGNA